MQEYGTALEPAQTTATTPSLNDRLRYAQELAQSGLLPSAYRGRPANVLVAIETGHMLGIAPMAALHGIYVIDGQPSYKAGFIAAQVRRAGHRMRTWWDSERQVAVTTIVRHDDPDFEYRSEWDLARAQRANLVQLRNGSPFKRDRKGNPLPWELYPENLLKARTISECSRDACEDVFYGSVYVPEELGAQVDSEGAPLVIDQQPEQPVEQAAASRIDWEGDLESLKDNYDGLRQLWQLAKGHGQPQEYLDRVKATGEAIKPVDNDPQNTAPDPVEAEVVDENQEADPQQDAPLCPGSTVDPDERGSMVITDPEGREVVLCEDCDQQVRVHNGRVLPHGTQRTSEPENDGDIDWDEAIRQADGDAETLLELGHHAAQQLGEKHPTTETIREHYRTAVKQLHEHAE